MTPEALKGLLDFITAAKDFGIAGFLILILVGGYRKWWVWGWLYEQKSKEAERWQDLALSSTSLAERVADLADNPRRRQQKSGD
jgi:hypothetical protein